MVVQVAATDADDPTYGNSARVIYSIIHGQPYFSVEPKTGGYKHTPLRRTLEMGCRAPPCIGPGIHERFGRRSGFLLLRSQMRLNRKAAFVVTMTTVESSRI